MPAKKKIAVIFGAVAPDAPHDEQDVLTEVGTVADALCALGYEPVEVPVTLDLISLKKTLLDINPYLVFNLVESIEGKGRYIHLAPVVLEELRLPYTGASQQAIFLTSGKILSKEMMRTAGIRTADWQLIPGKNGDYSRAENLLDPPYIVKSVWEHASIGLDEHSLFFSREALQLFLNSHAHDSRDEFFIEAYIDGREFNLSVVETETGMEVLPPAEIIFRDFSPGKPRIVGYRAKWDADSFEYSHTPRSFDFPDTDNALLIQLKTTALRCCDVFRITGYCRVDFRVDAQGVPYVLEVNVNPGIAPDSGFTAAVEKSGMTITELVERIVNCTVRRSGFQKQVV